MSQATIRKPLRGEWGEEQLRYRILRTVYDLTDGRCEASVTQTSIGAALDLRYEDLFRVVNFLSAHDYLATVGDGSNLCITRQGADYIETVAGRRRSVRREDPAASDDPV
jgi:hypothetical protein